MGNIRTSAIIMIILIALILIVMTIISAISINSTDTTELTEYDLIEILESTVDESVDKITSYLEIPYRVGKYHDFSEIRQIAFEITPLISKEIDMYMTIRLSNENKIKYLEYNGYAAKIESNYLFDHPIWDKLTENDFSYIVIHDKDNSMTKNNTTTINDNDRAFVIIELSEELYMKKGDKIAVTFIPNPGIERTILIEAPLPKNIVEI